MIWSHPAGPCRIKRFVGVIGALILLMALDAWAEGDRPIRFHDVTSQTQITFTHDDGGSGGRKYIVESVSAVTLAVADMARAVEFYETLGFVRRSGGPQSTFTSFAVGDQYLNVYVDGQGAGRHGWGRIIFYVSDVDAMHARASRAGMTPQFPPRDADWGERYFHLVDPDGHELSFARPFGPSAAPTGDDATR